MLQRKDNIDKISTKLAILAHKVELNTSLNLMDLNIHPLNLDDDRCMHK